MLIPPMQEIVERRLPSLIVYIPAVVCPDSFK